MHFGVGGQLQQGEQFLPGRRYGLSGPSGFGSAGHYQRAAVAVAADGAVDIVGQAAGFPQALEQAAAHAVAQHAVEHGGGVAVGVVQGKGRQAEANAGLLGSPAVQ